MNVISRTQAPQPSDNPDLSKLSDVLSIKYPISL